MNGVNSCNISSPQYSCLNPQNSFSKLYESANVMLNNSTFYCYKVKGIYAQNRILILRLFTEYNVTGENRQYVHKHHNQSLSIQKKAYSKTYDKLILSCVTLQ